MAVADVPAVAVIEKQAYPAAQAWSEGIFRDCLRVGYLCQVLEVDADLVGYGILSIAAGEAHLLNVCVAPGRQGRGFGRVLVEHFLDLADRYKARHGVPGSAPVEHARAGALQIVRVSAHRRAKILLPGATRRAARRRHPARPGHCLSAAPSPSSPERARFPAAFLPVLIPA